MIIVGGIAGGPMSVRVDQIYRHGGLIVPKYSSLSYEI